MSAANENAGMTWYSDAWRRPLPALEAALRHRYPGVRVTSCEFRKYHCGAEGVTVSFSAEDATLERYGLAATQDRRSPRRRYDDHDEWGTHRCGGSGYVFHHNYDDRIKFLDARPWPPKWAEKEVARIWRRISGSRLQIVPRSKP